MSPAVEGREDGPLHDGVRVFDSTYEDGAWDTLTFFLPSQRMVLVGLKVGPFELTHKDGSKQRLQGNMAYSMVRGDRLDYVMTIGGGD